MRNSSVTAQVLIGPTDDGLDGRRHPQLEGRIARVCQRRGVQGRTVLWHSDNGARTDTTVSGASALRTTKLRGCRRGGR
jgi:hypothetical protein